MCALPRAPAAALRDEACTPPPLAFCCPHCSRCRPLRRTSPLVCNWPCPVSTPRSCERAYLYHTGNNQCCGARPPAVALKIGLPPVVRRVKVQLHPAGSGGEEEIQGPCRGGAGRWREAPGQGPLGDSSAEQGRGSSSRAEPEGLPKRTPNRILGAAAPRQNSCSSATRETTPANPGRPGQPIALARSPAGSAQSSPAAHFRGARPTPQSGRFQGLQGRRSAGSDDRTQRRERGAVSVAPGRYAHPKSRAFWLGGGSEGRRAQGQ